MAGQKPHEVTQEKKKKVAELVSFGIRRSTIAYILGISEDTLERKYREELDHGTDMCVSEVAKTLFEKAVFDKDVTSMIFFLKTRGRWRTEDSKGVIDSNEKLKEEIAKFREENKDKFKKDY